MRLLIVDDNEDTTDTAAELFTLWDHDVQIAHSGSEALNAAAKDPPDAVLLDIGLPGMDGYEVARHLRQDPRLRNVIVIGISGYGQEKDRQLSREAGFDLHLIKPVDLEKLNGLLIEKMKARQAAARGQSK
ncbi:MAG: response regulator [Candidatus Binataceae bacterium]